MKKKPYHVLLFLFFPLLLLVLFSVSVFITGCSSSSDDGGGGVISPTPTPTVTPTPSPTVSPGTGSVEVTAYYGDTTSPVSKVMVTIESVTGTTDENGKATLQNISPGQHNMTVTCDNFENCSDMVDVVADQTVSITMQLTPVNNDIPAPDPGKGHIIGYVKNTAGNGMAGVTCTLSPKTKETVTTDSSGRYVFLNIAPGNYIVSFSYSGYTIPAVSVSVSANQTASSPNSTGTSTGGGGGGGGGGGETGWEFKGLIAPQSFQVGSNPNGIATGDLNGDNKPDIVTANFQNNNVSVFLGNGDGTFETAVNYAVRTAPWPIAIGDLNGDSNPDLAVANSVSDNGSVLLGNGDGTFQARLINTVNFRPVSVTTGDINGDNKQDLLTANAGGYDVSVLLGNGDGTFKGSANFTAGKMPFSVVLIDIDRDGKPDVFTSNSSWDNVSILFQRK